MAKLLITGGAGFIGTHTSLVLLEAGYDLIILDSFINSSPIALKRVSQISGLNSTELARRLKTYTGDIRDLDFLENIFKTCGQEGNPIDAVIHFAGLKSVDESVKNPLLYWDVNLNGTKTLLTAMEKNNCRTIVFSSSATIYGKAQSIPIQETAKIQPINPYGKTKAAIENILSDLTGINPNWRIACLRYFNPVGAHPTGLIGENPLGTPNNLFPVINQVAINKLKVLKIFGGDWPTPDKTAMRDYIHIMDLAEGHLAALNYLKNSTPELITLNLGSGKGYSVLEVVSEYQKVCRKKLPFEVVNRRQGDSAISIADPSKALTKLGWQTKRTLNEMVRDGWNWQVKNPKGYLEEERK